MLLWIPSHCGISVNKEADDLAVKGKQRKKVDIPSTTFLHRKCKEIIKFTSTKISVIVLHQRTGQT